MIDLVFCFTIPCHLLHLHLLSALVLHGERRVCCHFGSCRKTWRRVRMRMRVRARRICDRQVVLGQCAALSDLWSRKAYGPAMQHQRVRARVAGGFHLFRSHSFSRCRAVCMRVCVCALSEGFVAHCRIRDEARKRLLAAESRCAFLHWISSANLRARRRRRRPASLSLVSSGLCLCVSSLSALTPPARQPADISDGVHNEHGRVYL